MIWIVMILGIIFILFIQRQMSKSDSSLTASRSSGTTYSSTVSSGRQLDKDNIYDICYALGCLVAGNDGSSVCASIQYDPAKDISPLMCIATILDAGSKGYFNLENLKKPEEFQKLYVPKDIAQFLSFIPFEITIDSDSSCLNYSIKLDTKSYSKAFDFVEKALRNGFAANSLASQFHHTCEISRHSNCVYLRVD